jgi:hypothetical protein
MTGISLPDPVLRRSGPPTVDAAALERDLRQRVDGEVRFDAGSMAPRWCLAAGAPAWPGRPAMSRS